MPKNTERKCIVCGKTYSFCPSCKNASSGDGWRFLYHDENCRDMCEILFSYRGKEITKEQAKRKLMVYKPNIDDTLKNDSITAKEIQDIFDIKKEVEESDKEVIEEEVKVETPEVEIEQPQDDQVEPMQEKQPYKSRNNKNSKK